MAIRRFRRLRRPFDRRVFRRRFCVDSMDEFELRQRFRFSYASILFILDLILPSLQNMTERSKPVSPLLQLLVALRFYATGAFFRLIGDSVGLSESTVSRCVHRVSRALAALAKRFVRFPEGVTARTTQQDFYRLSSEYRSKL